MNWLNRLLGKPPIPPARVPSARRTAAPPPATVDAAALRQALAATMGEADRLAREAQLGAVLGAALQVPLAHDGPAVWQAAVCHAADRTLALSWLANLGAESDLAVVARAARFAEVRLAAAQRIDSSAALDALARASRNHDKSVYRHCADVLRQRRDDNARRERALALAAALQERLRAAPLSVSHILELERQWKALEADGASLPPAPATAQALQAGRDLLALSNARLLQEAEAQRSLQNLHGTVQARAADAAAARDRLVAADAALALPAELLAAWRQEHDRLAQARLGLPAWLHDQVAARALDAALADLSSHLDALDALRGRIAAAELAAADAAAALAAAVTIAAPPPDRDPAPAAAGEQAPAQPAGPAPDPDDLRARIDTLEQAIEDGQLAHAESAAQQIKSALGEHRLEARLDARLQRAQAQLAGLRGWAKWGATKKREDLVGAAQELRAAVAAGTHDVEHLAVAIPALREEWKRLNSQAPAAKGQWDAFDGALAAAYTPVAVLRAAESQRRAAARAVRTALLADWDAAAAAALAAEPADGGAIEALREQMIAQWRAAPHAGYRDERALRARFDALLEALDGRLENLRRAQLERREQLIAEVSALVDLPDTRAAIAQAKGLQERWRLEAGAMRLRRADEQKLWQRFRAGCDAVFARRDAEREAERALRAQQQQARSALVDAFAGVLAQADEAQALQRALQQFRAQWGDGAAADADGGAAAAALEHRARAVQRQAQLRIDELQRAAVHARYARLAAAAPAPDGHDAATLERGRQQRHELLIDLEIALGLASPGASAERRRQRQLEQLQHRFRPGPAVAVAEADPDALVARWYGLAAAPDADHEARIALVVQRLVERATARTVTAAAPVAAPRPRAGGRGAAARPAGTPAGRSPAR